MSGTVHPDVIKVGTGRPVPPDPGPAAPGPVNTHPGPDLDILEAAE